MSYKDPEARRKYCREWRRTHPQKFSEEQLEKRRIYVKEWRKHWIKTEHGKEVIARNKHNSYLRHREEIVKRRSHLKRRYGIIVAAWDQMIVSQSGRCDCCGLDFLTADKKGGPHVDHDHVTGKVRALVCQHCNVAIGWLESRRDTLILAAAYLRRHTDVAEDLPQDVIFLGPDN